MNSKQEELALRKLGEFFYGLSQGESGAIVCVQTLLASDAIADDEKRFLGETVLREEYQHKLLTHEWAHKLNAEKGDAFGVHYMRDMRLTVHMKDSIKVPWALTMLRFGEELSLRSFPIWSKQIREWQPELAQMLDQIVADEIDHVKMDHSIHNRWKTENVKFARVHETLYHEARRVYPVTISRATARTWEEIEKCLVLRAPRAACG
jgi:hypothetical protein